MTRLYRLCRLPVSDCPWRSAGCRCIFSGLGRGRRLASLREVTLHHQPLTSQLAKDQIPPPPGYLGPCILRCVAPHDKVRRLAFRVDCTRLSFPTGSVSCLLIQFVHPTAETASSPGNYLEMEDRRGCICCLSYRRPWAGSYSSESW